MDKCCAYCKYCDITSTIYIACIAKCKKHWRRNYITGDKIYESCSDYNSNGECTDYEQNLITKIINKLKRNGQTKA